VVTFWIGLTYVSVWDAFWATWTTPLPYCPDVGSCAVGNVNTRSVFVLLAKVSVNELFATAGRVPPGRAVAAVD